MNVLSMRLLLTCMFVAVCGCQEGAVDPDGSSQTAVEDACDDDLYTVLDDERRNSGFSSMHVVSTELLSDHSLQEGWYRFMGNAGTRMPTECVPMGMCATRYPVWMDGRLPANRNNAVVTGCINTEEDGCCNVRIRIVVRNCGAFYIYYLPRLPRCVRPAAFCTDSGPWLMVFKAMAGISEPDPYDLWTSEEALNENIPEAAVIGTGYQGHFKSMLVKDWNSLNIAEVRVSLYSAGIEVLRIVFDGSGTDKTSWFDGDKVLSSPYKDLNASVKSIHADHLNYRFMMMRTALYDCWNANGWFLMIASPGGCSWENDSPFPMFKYSRTNAATIWDLEQVGEADELAIFMKTEEAPVCRKKSYQVLDNRERGVNWRGSGDPVVDDTQLAPGWYRFDSPAGEEITHYCQNIGSCGTRYPIWLLDVQYTESGETVKGIMCVNTDDPGCCNIKIMVLVRNCGGFYIYRLPQLNTDQPAGYCTGFIEWDLVMKGVSLPDVYHNNIYKLWASNQSVNADVPEAQLLDTSFPEPFKSSLVNNWHQMDVQQIRLSLYKNGREVRRFIFNGVGSDRFNWFSRDRIIETPYTDMTSNTTYTQFTMGSKDSRQFFINSVDGIEGDFCSKAEGWLAVSSSSNDCLSTHGDRQQSFLYSARDTSVRWASGLVESADVIAIFIKSPLLINPCRDRSHVVLTDIRRGRDMRNYNGRSLSDQSIRPGWYRFTDTKGEPLDMPTSCVELDHCGTRYPIWVDDKLPDRPGARVPLEGCINTEEDGCCNIRLALGALHCGDYIVYALNQVPSEGEDEHKYYGYCTESDNWEMVFKLTDGFQALSNNKQLWRQQFSLNTDIPPARKLDKSFPGNYKTGHVRLWEELNIDKVKLSVYKDEMETICLIFDGEGTDSLSWFSQENLIFSPWSDLTKESECNVFSIEGQYTPEALGTRRWLINKKLSPCVGGSEGWLMIIADSGFLCSFKRTPQILFSNTTIAEPWSSGSLEKGDFVTIFISTKKRPT
ncbi:uncharacterized protein LOC117295114 [Asterias rubens]|uniref:uncharacterized protein LOC117295114 n=1 Tax=Asterias rubens TaxID=7604 RepID=UPI000FECB9AD|nr:uncharacterized protein LOC117295114 [Asterias rubens]